MITSKEDFIRTFMPSGVERIDCAQINLDITDLSVSDILRNFAKVYPKNSRNRNAIASGRMVAAALCKTDTIDPMTGIFLILTNDSLSFEMVSKNYIIMCVSESYIDSDESIALAIEKITKYMVKEFKGSLNDLATFYSRFIYDPFELESEGNVYLPRTVDYEGLDN